MDILVKSFPIFFVMKSFPINFYSKIISSAFLDLKYSFFYNNVIRYDFF